MEKSEHFTLQDVILKSLSQFEMNEQIYQFLDAWEKAALTGHIQPRIIILDVIGVEALLRDAQFCILM